MSTFFLQHPLGKLKILVYQLKICDFMFDSYQNMPFGRPIWIWYTKYEISRAKSLTTFPNSQNTICSEHFDYNFAILRYVIKNVWPCIISYLWKWGQRKGAVHVPLWTKFYYFISKLLVTSCTVCRRGQLTIKSIAG